MKWGGDVLSMPFQEKMAGGSRKTSPGCPFLNKKKENVNMRQGPPTSQWGGIDARAHGKLLPQIWMHSAATATSIIIGQGREPAYSNSCRRHGRHTHTPQGGKPHIL